MLEKATVLTTIFPSVDDVIKGSPMIQQTLDRPGPAPSLCDNELVTIELYQELIDFPREDHLFRLHQEQLRRFFPALNERSCKRQEESEPSAIPKLSHLQSNQAVRTGSLASVNSGESESSHLP